MNLVHVIADVQDAVAEDDPLPPVDRPTRSSQRLMDNLYRRQAPRLLRLFGRRAGYDEAADLVQEAFARFASRGDAVIEQIEEPAAYLSRVATNLLRDRAKFEVRRSGAHHQSFDDETVGGADPIERLETRDLLRRLNVAIDRLKPRPRQVFLLQRVEGMTYAQISESTG
ncbi:MAG: RNA polymerase sigma factor, partial [Pseudomonadota bacterium]|nr:RNA polymerase sigma factor [Pseudomonadota bacterium]